jgi:hypothetical protein
MANWIEQTMLDMDGSSYPLWLDIMAVVIAALRFITLRTSARYGMAETLNIDILQGDTFDWEILVQDSNGEAMDLTGCTVRGMGRIAFTSVTPAWSFSCSVYPDQVVDRGKISVEVSAEITAALRVRRHVYDIELVTAENRVKKLYRGAAKVSAEVTR